VRAVILDVHDRVLLVQFTFSRPAAGVSRLWATPGGGVEDGEDDRSALVRELAEETGLHEPVIGPLIWTRTHLLPMPTGHDGQVERFYLVRTQEFEARPTLTTEQLGAENVTRLRWWTADELANADDVVFAPRRLPELVVRLAADGPPSRPIDVGV
jgi:8-oxo-dGTP diphosphatase